MDKLERRILEFVVRHPKSIAAAITLSGLMLDGKFSYTDIEKSDPTFAVGALTYTALTLAKDYWLKDREKIEYRSWSLYEDAITSIRNNPKIVGCLSGIVMGAQSLSMHAGDIVRSACSYLAGFALGYWACELSKQQAIVRGSRERRKSSLLADKALNLYDAILERPDVLGACVALVNAGKYLNLDQAATNFFNHATALCFVSGVYGVLAYVCGSLASSVLHTSSLKRFKLMYKRFWAERRNDISTAIDIQEKILEMPMTIKQKLAELARLAGYHSSLGNISKSLTIAGEMVSSAEGRCSQSSPLDLLAKVFVPRAVEHESVQQNAASSQGVELALYHFTHNDFERSLRAWGDVIDNSTNPDYFRMLQAQNIRAMGKSNTANMIIWEVIYDNMEKFVTRAGSKHKIITFTPGSDLNEIIAIKTPADTKSEEHVASLKNEFAVMNYVQSCVRDRSPIPIIYVNEEGEGIAYLIMSYIRGRNMRAALDDPMTRKETLARLMRELAIFQRKTSENREKLERFKAKAPELSLTSWGKKNIIERLLGEDAYSFIAKQLETVDGELITHRTLFSNGDLQVDNIMFGRHFYFLDFEKACFALPAFTLFELFEDSRTGITQEEKSMCLKLYLDELNKDTRVVQLPEFEYTYDMIYAPRMLGAVVMFHDYSGRDPAFARNAARCAQKLRDFKPREKEAKAFKDAALEFVYSTNLERYIA